MLAFSPHLISVHETSHSFNICMWCMHINLPCEGENSTTVRNPVVNQCFSNCGLQNGAGLWSIAYKNIFLICLTPRNYTLNKIKYTLHQNLFFTTIRTANTIFKLLGLSIPHKDTFCLNGLSECSWIFGPFSQWLSCSLAYLQFIFGLLKQVVLDLVLLQYMPLI